MKIARVSLGVSLAAASLVAKPASAQTESFTDVPETYRIEAGGFHIGADTELSFSTSGGPRPPVDFESLDVPETATHFYLEAYWRPWRRHEFSLSWYGNNREGEPRTLSRDISWGDRVIEAGASAAGTVGSDYFSGVYRFAAYKNDRFEVGPSLGLGHLSLRAGITGEGTATTPSGTVNGDFDVSTDLGQITGDVGAYFYWWPLRRLQVRGDLRYIVVRPGDSEASVTDGRVGLVYHFTRNVGFGLQYTYTKFRYDREVLSTELGGRLRYSGGQVLLSAAF